MTRLMCVLALLSGLFFMHGVSGGIQCHGAHDVMVHASGHSAVMHEAPTGVLLVADVVAHVGVCLSTLPGWPTVALLLLLLMAGLLPTPGGAPGGRVLVPGRRVGRAPPVAGVALLHRLCVSRT